MKNNLDTTPDELLDQPFRASIAAMVAALAKMPQDLAQDNATATIMLLVDVYGIFAKTQPSAEQPIYRAQWAYIKKELHPYLGRVTFITVNTEGDHHCEN